jgi:hypothetical protein
MVKFHNVFLIASLFMSLNLFTASENQKTAEYSRSSSFDDLQSTSLSNQVSQSPVMLSRTNSFVEATTPGTTSTAVTSEIAVQGSSLFTKVWYGVSKKLGKSATQTLFELAENKTLEGDAITNTAEAIRRFIDAIEERHTARDLTHPANQEKIGQIFAITNTTKEKTGVEIEIAQALAKKYNQLQATALKTILHEQATVHQPAYQQEKETAINLAHDIYNNKMSILLKFAAQTADNKRYVHAQAQDATVCDLQNERHYVNPVAHEALLQSIRDQLTQKSQAK